VGQAADQAGGEGPGLGLEGEENEEEGEAHDRNLGR
jgi:hypothetical protein